MVDVKVYSTSFCGYCVRAKALLAERGIAFDEIDVTGDHSAREDLVRRSGGRRTVPQIFIKDQPIGGYDELRALALSGRLDELLAG